MQLFFKKRLLPTLEGKVVHEKKSNYSTWYSLAAGNIYLWHDHGGMVGHGRCIYRCSKSSSLTAGSQHIISQTEQEETITVWSVVISTKQLKS